MGTATEVGFGLPALAAMVDTHTNLPVAITVDMRMLLLNFVISSGVKNENVLWGGILACVVGCVFLRSGLTRRPLRFNPFNPWKKPLSVRAARIVYLPAAGLCFFFGVRDIVRALW